MWFSDSLDIQHKVKLADGERNSMIVLLLASFVTVFPQLLSSHFSSSSCP